MYIFGSAVQLAELQIIKIQQCARKDVYFIPLFGAKESVNFNGQNGAGRPKSKLKELAAGATLKFLQFIQGPKNKSI
jgi:hypothetical protein